MSNPIADPGHGHSPAAWTAVCIMLFGMLFGTVFFVLGMPIMVYIAGVIVIIGLIVGAVMAKMGYGVNGPKFVAKEH